MQRRIWHLSRTAFKVAVIILIILASLEALLQTLDPNGTRQYMQDLRYSMSEYEYADNRWHLSSNHHTFSNWTARIVKRQRFTPDATPGRCHILAVGDSMTFGWGVNDADTWVNLLAQQFPSAYITQYAHSGWNARDVREAIADADADGYIYLLISNDHAPESNPDPTTALQFRFAAQDYLYWHRKIQAGRSGGFLNPSADFWRDMAYFDGLDNLLWFGFDDRTLPQMVQAQYSGITLIPRFDREGRISATDGHPNAAGHQQMADDMLPAVRTFIEGVC